MLQTLPVIDAPDILALPAAVAQALLPVEATTVAEEAISGEDEPGWLEVQDRTHEGHGT